MSMTHSVAFESLRAEPDYLSLKFGSWKSYEANSEPFRKALQEYFDLATSTGNAQELKEALCRVVDACSGEIYNDWAGTYMTKEKAKKYIMEYDQ
jgi:hypothetical protein